MVKVIHAVLMWVWTGLAVFWAVTPTQPPAWLVPMLCGLLAFIKFVDLLREP